MEEVLRLEAIDRSALSGEEEARHVGVSDEHQLGVHVGEVRRGGRLVVDVVEGLRIREIAMGGDRVLKPAG